MIKKILVSIYNWLELQVISPIRWTYLKGLFNKGKYWNLTDEDNAHLLKVLKPHYYLILTFRKTHLTSYLQIIASYLMTGKTTHWTHAFLNMDDGEATDPIQYIFLESTSEGVHYSVFNQVFDCDSVALIIPKGMTPQDWTDVIDTAIQQDGKPYDTLFNYHQEKSLSCIELVRVALMGMPDYATRFANFEALIQKEGKVTPEMLAQCSDFHVHWVVMR